MPIPVRRQLAEYEQARPESHESLGEIRRLLAEDQFYRALKTAKLLIQHEEEAETGSPDLLTTAVGKATANRTD